MRKRAWSCRPRKKRWVATTDSNHGLPIYPNLTKRLSISTINQPWVADITYIRILTCFVYPAVMLDAFSRRAIGYAVSRTIDARLTLDPLRMAICNRHPLPGCIHHSNRSVQYASGGYVKELVAHGFQISMSTKGNPYDNAYAESFVKTLKSEEVSLWEYRTMEDVHQRTPYFIEDLYNQKRLHSSLGYRPPSEFEAMAVLTHNPCQRTLITSS